MIRTILSSFLFLIPIYISYEVRDKVGLFMYSIAMGMSIANHSHTFHTNLFRRTLFMRLDIIYISFIAFYHVLYSLYYINVILVCIGTFVNYYIYHQLSVVGRIEDYNQRLKRMHVLFHLVGISTLTISRYYPFIK